VTAWTFDCALSSWTLGLSFVRGERMVTSGAGGAVRRVPTATGQAGAALRADEVRPAGGVTTLASGEGVARIPHSDK
jgi:hypothetical protein